MEGLLVHTYHLSWPKSTNYLHDGDPTTKSLVPLDQELDKEQLNAEATCRVARVGFRTTAHGDNADPDIKITRWNNIPRMNENINKN